MEDVMISKIECQIDKMIERIAEIGDHGDEWRKSREQTRQDALLNGDAAKAEFQHDLVRVYDHGATTMRETMKELESLRELVAQLRRDSAQAA